MTGMNQDGGAVDQTADAGGMGGEQSDQDLTGQSKSVSWDDHQRALADLHRFKGQSKALSAQLANIQSEFESLKGEVATKNKDFENLYASEKSKREAIESEKTKLLNNVLNSERHRAAYPALKKAGLRDDAENLLDIVPLDLIDVEATSSGRFTCSGIDDFVEDVKKKFPYAFQRPAAPVVNGASGTGSAGAGSGAWTPAKLVALENECRKKKDMEPYRKAVEEWRKQGKPT